jgi:hypothetical protein
LGLVDHAMAEFFGQNDGVPGPQIREKQTDPNSIAQKYQTQE